MNSVAEAIRLRLQDMDDAAINPDFKIEGPLLRRAMEEIEALNEAREWSRLRGEDLRKLGIAAGAAHAFVEKLALCQPEIDARFTMAWVHGDRYAGPNYAAELLALKNALADVGLSSALPDRDVGQGQRVEQPAAEGETERQNGPYGEPLPDE